MFGASAIECGHYENLSLDEAKKECRAYLKVLESQTKYGVLLTHSKQNGEIK